MAKVRKTISGGGYFSSPNANGPLLVARLGVHFVTAAGGGERLGLGTTHVMRDDGSRARAKLGNCG